MLLTDIYSEIESKVIAEIAKSIRANGHTRDAIHFDDRVIYNSDDGGWVADIPVLIDARRRSIFFMSEGDERPDKDYDFVGNPDGLCIFGPYDLSAVHLCDLCAIHSHYLPGFDMRPYEFALHEFAYSALTGLPDGVVVDLRDPITVCLGDGCGWSTPDIVKVSNRACIDKLGFEILLSRLCLRELCMLADECTLSRYLNAIQPER